MSSRVLSSPEQLKQEQHKRYDEIAMKVARGELGYVPAQKSRYSKSCRLKVKCPVKF